MAQLAADVEKRKALLVPEPSSKKQPASIMAALKSLQAEHDLKQKEKALAAAQEWVSANGGKAGEIQSAESAAVAAIKQASLEGIEKLLKDSVDGLPKSDALALPKETSLGDNEKLVRAREAAEAILKSESQAAQARVC